MLKLSYETKIKNGGICGIDKHTKFAISSRIFSIYGDAPTLTVCNTTDNSKIVIQNSGRVTIFIF